MSHHEEVELISDGFEVDFDDDLLEELTNDSRPINNRLIQVEMTSKHKVQHESGLKSAITSTFPVNGPNIRHKTTSNWILGVKHLSLASDRLNQRMAGRGVLFTESNDNTNTKFNVPQHVTNERVFHDANRKVMASGGFPILNHIDESEEYYDTFDSLQSDSNRSKEQYQQIEKHRVTMSTPLDQSVNSKHKESKSNYRNDSIHQIFKCDELIVESKSSAKSKVHNTQSNVSFDDGNCHNEIRTNKSDHLKSKKSNDRRDSNQRVSHQTSNGLTEHTKHSLSKNSKRSVNRVTLTAKQELHRYRRQCISESASLIIIIIAVIFVTITPFLLIPIWVVPNQYSHLIQNLLWVSLGMSVISLTIGALIGNIYWYYDPKCHKWKWFYHCGKGPADHYWGTTIFHYEKPSHMSKQHTNGDFNV